MYYSFQDAVNLYLIMEFLPGGKGRRGKERERGIRQGGKVIRVPIVQDYAV